MPKKPRQTLVTEELIAAALPLGAKKTSREIWADLDLCDAVSISGVGGILKGMRDRGFLAMHRCTNTAHRWERLREPTLPPSSKTRDKIAGFVIERVPAGGRKSGGYGMEYSPETLVSLPKMPKLSIDA